MTPEEFKKLLSDVNIIEVVKKHEDKFSRYIIVLTECMNEAQQEINSEDNKLYDALCTVCSHFIKKAELNVSVRDEILGLLKK